MVGRDKKYSCGKKTYVVVVDHIVHFSRVVKMMELMDKPQLTSKLQLVSYSETSHMFDKLGKRNHTFKEILDRCHTAMEESMMMNEGKAATLSGVKKVAFTKPWGQCSFHSRAGFHPKRRLSERSIVHALRASVFFLASVYNLDCCR